MINWSKVLEAYTLEEILERMDVSVEQVLEMLEEQGYEMEGLPVGVEDD